MVMENEKIDIFTVLGKNHSARMGILANLCYGPLSVQELMRITKIKNQNQIQKDHLDKLEKMNIVQKSPYAIYKKGRSLKAYSLIAHPWVFWMVVGVLIVGEDISNLFFKARMNKNFKVFFSLDTKKDIIKSEYFEKMLTKDLIQEQLRNVFSWLSDNKEELFENLNLEEDQKNRIEKILSIGKEDLRKQESELTDEMIPLIRESPLLIKFLFYPELTLSMLLPFFKMKPELEIISNKLDSILKTKIKPD
jgi:hypothetical protein